jgi:hypothetical protein
MLLAFTPNDWYWFVGGDMARVWSSKRMQYVSSGDDQYRAWLAAAPGNLATQIPSAADLSAVMQGQIISGYFTSGLVVTSASTPPINATYGLDPVTLDQIGTVARDVSSGLGFPLGAPTFAYPDINGTLMSLSEQNVQDLYKAMRNYIAQVTYAVQTLVMGGTATLPSNVVTIP